MIIVIVITTKLVRKYASIKWMAVGRIRLILEDQSVYTA